jgi:hypothetical protein
MMGRRPHGWQDAVMIPLWDGRQVPGRWICGLPAFRYGWAPDGLATRRQLRTKRLCPGVLWNQICQVGRCWFRC